MDRLAKLIKDINNGTKTEKEALKALEFLAWREDSYQNEKQMKVVTKMVDGHTDMYSVTPEEIVLEKERKMEIIEFQSELSSCLTEKQKEALWLYAVEGIKPAGVAERLEITMDRLRHIRARIKVVAKNMGGKALLFKDHLRVPQSTLEPHKPESCGLPFEFLMRQNDGGRIGKKYGRKVYISKEKCLIPEYFEKCFGKDHQVACPLCENKCTRKDYFKDRKRG